MRIIKCTRIGSVLSAAAGPCRGLSHLDALGVHHSIETEIQVGLVELEQLLQLGLQLFVFLAHKSFSVCVESSASAQSGLIGHLQRKLQCMSRLSRLMSGGGSAPPLAEPDFPRAQPIHFRKT